MDRKEFWTMIFTEVIRKNGAGGDAQKAIDEANLSLKAFDKIEKTVAE